MNEKNASLGARLSGRISLTCVSLYITALDLEVWSLRISPRPVCRKIEEKNLKPWVSTSEVRLALLPWCQAEEKGRAWFTILPTPRPEGPA